MNYSQKYIHVHKHKHVYEHTHTLTQAQTNKHKHTCFRLEVCSCGVGRATGVLLTAAPPPLPPGEAHVHAQAHMYAHKHTQTHTSTRMHTARRRHVLAGRGSRGCAANGRAPATTRCGAKNSLTFQHHNLDHRRAAIGRIGHSRAIFLGRAFYF